MNPFEIINWCSAIVMVVVTIAILGVCVLVVRAIIIGIFQND